VIGVSRFRHSAAIAVSPRPVGIPYARWALIKNRMSPQPHPAHQAMRERVFASSSIPLPDVLAGKRVVVIDDRSCVHHKPQSCAGPCARPVAHGGAHLRISSTAVTHPCFYGHRHRHTQEQLILPPATPSEETTAASGVDSWPKPEPGRACSEVRPTQGRQLLPPPFEWQLPDSEDDSIAPAS